MAQRITETFEWTLWGWGTLAVILIMLSSYLAGEYFDYEVDCISQQTHPSRFAGGSGTLQAGSVPRYVPLIGSVVALILAMIVGLIIQLGCIGFPAHPAWEVTTACNLRCIHCHASGGQPAPDELTTNEAKRFLDELARVDEFRILVYTGSEPLVRPDIFELLAYSHQLGFANVLATNATLIDETVAKRLRQVGVVGAAVGLDGPTAPVHNHIRNMPKAYLRAMAGIQALRKARILLQINVTAMTYNIDHIDELIALSDDLRASIMLIYQLVPAGRGHEIATASLDLGQNERLLHFLAERQCTTHTIVEPVAGPQYWPYLLKKRGLIGNLRHRESRLERQCGDCRYNTICGGCRGRAWALTSNYLASDPSCFIV